MGNEKEIITIGDWYDQLSPFRKCVFDILCRIVGEGIAIEIGGYRSYVRKHTKKEAH